MVGLDKISILHDKQSKTIEFTNKDAIDSLIATQMEASMKFCLGVAGLSDVLLLLLGWETCIGVNLRLMPIQQIWSLGVFTQIVFAQLWAGGTFPTAAVSFGDRDSISAICTDPSLQYTCNDFCQGTFLCGGVCVAPSSSSHHYVDLSTVHIQKKPAIFDAQLSARILWFTKTLWSANIGLDSCQVPPPKSIIQSSYSSDPGSNYAIDGAWTPLFFTEGERQAIMSSQATAQSIIASTYPTVVYTNGDNTNYPGCGSALQCIPKT